MIPLKQTHPHDPPNSTGNCFRTCIAAILEVDPEEMPKFEYMESGYWWPAVTSYLATKGLRPVVWSRENNERTKIDELRETGEPKGFSIATGKSPRGDWDHCVVALHGELHHDVSPAHRCGPMLLDVLDYISFQSLEAPLPEAY